MSKPKKRPAPPRPKRFIAATVSLRLDGPLVDRLDHCCQTNEATRSEQIRNLLDEHLPALPVAAPAA